MIVRLIDQSNLGLPATAPYDTALQLGKSFSRKEAEGGLIRTLSSLL
jgi:hypothetical protein